jgi:hypothetical protein
MRVLDKNGAIKQTGVFDTANPASLGVDGAASPGTSGVSAHRDHVHAVLALVAANLGTRGTATASAATVTLPTDGVIVPITGTTTITSITAVTKGVVMLEFASAGCLVSNGSNLKLRSDYLSTAFGVLLLECDGTNWIEVARNPNHSQMANGLGSTSAPTTTSTTYVDATDLSVTLVTGGNSEVFVMATIPVHNSGAGNQMDLAFQIDGAADIQVATVTSAAANEDKMLVGVRPYTGLAVGSHTWKARWKTSAGTLTSPGTMRRILAVEVSH